MIEKPNYRAPVPNTVVGPPSPSGFIIGLSLSLSLSKTHRICWINMFLISIDIKQGWRQASHLEAGRWGMDIKPYCISNSGVQYEKHKCCSDFKHNEWLHQFASGHWSNCC